MVSGSPTHSRNVKPRLIGASGGTIGSPYGNVSQANFLPSTMKLILYFR